MNTLLIEIMASLFAAAFFSLFIGWAVRSALANREVEAIKASWVEKHSELELQYRQDTEHLQEQVSLLNTEKHQLIKRNDNINESLRENEVSVHKARADAIELNRQQADTQERLQRIIAQKDAELNLIRNDAALSDKNNISGAIGVAALSNEDTEAKIAALSAKRDAWESERQRLINAMDDDQETVAIDPSDLPSEPLDQTVRIDEIDDDLDSDSDSTLALDEDQTMLLDDNHMNPNRTKPSNDDPSLGGTPEDSDDR